MAKAFIQFILLCFLAGCSSDVSSIAGAVPTSGFAGFFGSAPSISTAKPGFDKRLIVGSGAGVLKKFPWSRPVTPQDITIDIAGADNPNNFINPTYVANGGDVKVMTDLSKQFKGAFSEVIIEHIGNGFPQFLTCQQGGSVDCYNQLFQLMRIYNDMITPGGTFTYESYRYSVADKGVDVGSLKLLENLMVSAEKMMNWPRYSHLSEDQLQQYLRDFSTHILTHTGFEAVTFQVKKDTEYGRFQTAPQPYYYVEIRAKKSATAATPGSSILNQASGLLGGADPSGAQGILSQLPIPPLGRGSASGSKGGASSGGGGLSGILGGFGK